jgi:branched-chain amino acid transport system ATP-binding protein
MSLTVTNLTSGYLKDVPVVKELSAQFESGRVTLVIGPNGAGKSTLLRTVFGLIPSTAGVIELNHTALQDLAPWKRLQLGVGLVPQGRSSFPLMSVAENLQVAAERLPRPDRGAAKERVLALFAPLRDKTKTLAGNLSGGQQQMLEMAMVLQRPLSTLLIDEPSIGLSPKAQDELFPTIHALSRTGITVVMVEQHVRAGLAVSDSAIVMEQGRKSIEAPADVLLADPRIRTVYLGAAPTGTAS